jgi:hypothetical protein
VSEFGKVEVTSTPAENSFFMAYCGNLVFFLIVDGRIRIRYNKIRIPEAQKVSDPDLEHGRVLNKKKMGL